MKRMYAVAIAAGFFLSAAVAGAVPHSGGGHAGIDHARGGHSGGGHSGGGHSGHGHGGHGHVFVGGGVWVGPYWGPYWDPWWYPPYAYPPYGYPAYPYDEPVMSEPQSYIQQSPVPAYWYFCQDARAYYPYVKECPGGWLTVVPPTATEPQK